MRFKGISIAFVVTCLAANIAWAADDSGLPTAVITQREMVVTTHPLATEVGAYILKVGGTATDAMIAVQAMLGLVEPQSTGLGGGAFVVYYDARTGRTTTIDAREKAPGSATEDRFLENGSSIGFFNAWQSGLSVGVPGVPGMMAYMHERYGRLPWRMLFFPAEARALAGFRLAESTSHEVEWMLASNPSCDNGERLFFRDPAAFEYFVNVDDCTAKSAGTLIRNEAYAETLRTLARYGVDPFYNGFIAEAIAAAVQGDLHIPGDMTVNDLMRYEVVERAPVCIDYRSYQVCGMGPPSSGGLAVGQILGILENFDLTDLSPLDIDTVHLFSQAGRLAFADRNRYVADNDFVAVPVEGMLDKDYLANRAALITDMDMGTAEPGEPPGYVDPGASDNTAKMKGTSHVSIVDRYGNALSMTTTIESAFGNGVMVGGFLLNNELTDFSFRFEDENGLPIANRVEPDKRPRSSMSPTIVFDDKGRVALVTGSPGGAPIIGYTAQSIMNVLDFGLDPQEAINVPHYMNLNGGTIIETPIPEVTMNYDADALADALRAKGHEVDIVSQQSGVSSIQPVTTRHRRPWERRARQCHPSHVLIGGADARREGTVGGR